MKKTKSLLSPYNPYLKNNKINTYEIFDSDFMHL